MNSKLSTSNLLRRPPLQRRLIQRLLGRGPQQAKIVRHYQAQLKPGTIADIGVAIDPADVTADTGISMRPSDVTDIGIPVHSTDVTEIQMLAVSSVTGKVWSSGIEALEQMWRASKYSGAELYGNKELDRDKLAKLFTSDGLSALLPILNGDLFSRTYGPLSLPHSLYHFQRDGIDFLLKRDEGALLADDMGLGKTVQSIVALRMLFHHNKARNALIVAPKSVLVSWEKHFREWSPELKVKSLMGNPVERNNRWHSLAAGHFHVGIITYDSLRIDSDRLRLPPVDTVIADEVQMIKNPSAKRSQAMHRLRAKRRWALTGTPLENRVKEFWSILHFIDPRVEIAEDSQGYIRHGQHLHPVTLKSVTQELMLRRKKEKVLDQLPELVSNIQYVRMGAEQQRIYNRAKGKSVSKLRRKPRSRILVAREIKDLQQICNGVYKAGGKLDSPKLEWLLNYLEIAKRAGDKTLVFSQYTYALPADMKARFPLKYWGDMSNSERELAIEEFSTNTDHHAMLMSVRAGGLGLNLQAANRVIHFDSWPNPAVLMQATARAHRIKQKKTVFETTLITVNTIEERIQRILQHKRDLFKQHVDNQSVSGLARTLTVDELYSLFDLGPEASSKASSVADTSSTVVGEAMRWAKQKVADQAERTPRLAPLANQGLWRNRRRQPNRK